MKEFLDQFGYLALTIGTFFEGETAILVASSLIPEGIFSGPFVVLFAFLGSFASDWLYYFIGRFNGYQFISKRPKLQERFAPLQQFFIKHEMQVLLTYRFLYGLRVLIPVVVGMSGIRPMRYLIYSVVSGLTWAAIVSIAGYFAGEAFGLTIQTFEENLLWILLGFAAFGIAVGYLSRFLFSFPRKDNEVIL